MDRVERVQSSGRGSSRVEIKCVPLSGRYPSSSLTGKNKREREREVWCKSEEEKGVWPRRKDERLNRVGFVGLCLRFDSEHFGSH